MQVFRSSICCLVAIVAGVSQAADETEALQARIDEAYRAGGGIVRVPGGEHPVTSIRLRSRVTLYLESGARLVASRDPESYRKVFASDGVEPVPKEMLSDDASRKNRKLNGRWESAIVRLYAAEDAAIVGERGSVIDGRNCADPKGEENYRGPHGISAIACTNLQLKGYTLRDAGNYGHRIKSSFGVNIENVTVLGGHDGIDIHYCSDVKIRSCDFHTGDDCIAGFGDVNVVIRKCSFKSACSALRLGGTHVLVEDCDARGPCEYPHRWTLPMADRLASVSGESSAGRRNMGCFFQHGTSETLPVPPSDFVLRNITVENAGRFFVNLTGQDRIWMKGKSVPLYVFDNVRAIGLERPGAVCVRDDEPMKIVTRNCRFEFNKPVENAFLTHNVTFAHENLETRNVTGAFQRECEAREDVVVREFPSWRIEDDGALDVLGN